MDKATKCLATADFCGRRRKRDETAELRSKHTHYSERENPTHQCQGTDPLTSLAACRSHSLADSALVMVSWVVNVCKKGRRRDKVSPENRHTRAADSCLFELLNSHTGFVWISWANIAACVGFILCVCACTLTLEAMMKSVVSALSWARVLARWVPSMLETNQTFGPPAEYGFRASVTIRGPWMQHDTSYSFRWLSSRVITSRLPVKCWSQ